MAVTTTLFNHTARLVVSNGVNLSALKAALLNASAAFNAAHETIDQVLNGASSAVTITIASPGVVSWTGHGLSNGDLVMFTTDGALPTGLTAGAWYYVVNANTNDFQVSLTAGGAAIDTSGSQSGTHTAFSDGGYEVSGNGWTPGGEPVPNVVASTQTTNDAVLAFDDIEVTATGGDIGPAFAVCIYDSLTGKVIKYIDFGESTKASETTPFKLRNLTGLLALDYTAA